MNILVMIAILLIIPVFSLLLGIIGLVINSTSWKKYLPLIIYFIFILGYAYEPTGTPDIVRHFQIVEKCGGYSLGEAIRYLHDSLYFQDFLYWMCGILNMPHLLPALSIASVYSVAFYITGDTADYYKNQSDIWKVYLFQICMIPFFNSISNIFNIWAFALEALAAYLDIVKSKKSILILLLYIAPCFLHISGIVLLMLRLVLFVTKKIKVFILGLIVLVPMAISILFQNVNRFSDNSLISTLIKKAYWYMHDPLTSEYSRRVANSFAYKIDRIVMVSFAILLIIVIIKKQLENNNYDRFFSYLYMICLLTIALLPANTPQYWRSSACTMLCVGSIIIALKNHDNLSLLEKIWFIMLSFYMMMGLVLQIWNVRYIVDYGQVFTGVMFTNMFTVIWTLLRSIVLL